MKYLLRHHYQVFSHYTGSIDVGIVQHMKPIYKNLLFHHVEDVDNYIRNHVTAANLIKLEIEHLTVE